MMTTAERVSRILCESCGGLVDNPAFNRYCSTKCAQSNGAHFFVRDNTNRLENEKKLRKRIERHLSNFDDEVDIFFQKKERCKLEDMRLYAHFHRHVYYLQRKIITIIDSITKDVEIDVIERACAYLAMYAADMAACNDEDIFKNADSRSKKALDAYEIELSFVESLAVFV